MIILARGPFHVCVGMVTMMMFMILVVVSVISVVVIMRFGGCSGALQPPKHPKGNTDHDQR